MPETTGAPHADRDLVVVEVGDLVVDTNRHELARVMAVEPDWCALRPPRGGLEWNARRGVVRPALASEEQAERMRTKGLLSPRQDAR
jgi:hypothetical protein